MLNFLNVVKVARIVETRAKSGLLNQTIRYIQQKQMSGKSFGRMEEHSDGKRGSDRMKEKELKGGAVEKKRKDEKK